MKKHHGPVLLWPGLGPGGGGVNFSGGNDSSNYDCLL